MSDEFAIDAVELRRVESRDESHERCPLCGVILTRGSCPGCSGSAAAARSIQQLREELRANDGGVA